MDIYGDEEKGQQPHCDARPQIRREVLGYRYQRSFRLLRALRCALQVAMRSHGIHEPALELVVYREISVVLQELRHRRLRVVAFAPWLAREGAFRHVFDARIEYHYVAARRYKPGVGL